MDEAKPKAQRTRQTGLRRPETRPPAPCVYASGECPYAIMPRTKSCQEHVQECKRKALATSDARDRALAGSSPAIFEVALASKAKKTNKGGKEA